MTTVGVANDNSNPQQGAPFRGSRRAFRVPPSKKDDRKLFVGGLPGNITEVEFKEFFEKFGVLIDSAVMFDRETRRSRGFGFVTFEDPMVCRQLLMMGNEGADPENAMNLVGRLELQGKVCEVKAATPKEGGGTRNRHSEHTNVAPYRGRQARFDNGPPQLAPPGMHHAYYPGMPHGVYYPPPPFMPHPGCTPHPFMGYPHSPHPVPTVVPPVVEPHAGNPQHGNGFPYPPVIGIPVMPYNMPMEQQYMMHYDEGGSSSP